MARRRKRSSGSGAAAAADDRLSVLPDDILHHVLSLLMSWEAVRLCALSKRWARVWASMPCLDLDDGAFVKPSPSGEGFTLDNEKFAEFTDGLLRSHAAPCLETFRLHVHGHASDQALERWIRRGIDYRPSVLEIHLCGPFQFDLPDLGSSSRRLTRLHLGHVRLLDDSFSEQLSSSGCPVLEDLELRRCGIGIGFRAIRSNTLKNLVMDSCSSGRRENEMIIDAPSLSNLLICADGAVHPYGIRLTDQTVSIAKASICLTSYYACNYRDNMILLGCLVNVQHLELLGNHGLDILPEEPDKLPTFHNLKTLLFSDCSMLDRNQILFWRFLQNSPSLENLIIRRCKFSAHSKKKKEKVKSKKIFIEHQEPTSFECKNLKLIEIQDDKDNLDEVYSNLLAGIWTNLRGAAIKLTKVEKYKGPCPFG